MRKRQVHLDFHTSPYITELPVNLMLKLLPKC